MTILRKVVNTLLLSQSVYEKAKYSECFTAYTESVLGWQKSMKRYTTHAHNHDRVKGE